MIKPGQVLSPDDLTSTKLRGCVDAAPTPASFRSAERQGSAGFVVSGSGSGGVVSGGGRVEAKSFKLKSFTETTTLTIPELDVVLTEACQGKLSAARSRGKDISDWVVVQQTLSARVREVTCKSQEAAAKVRALWIAKGDVGEMSECVESFEATGVVALKSVPVAELMAVTPVVAPPRGDEWQGGVAVDLDMDAALAAQACDDAAEALGAKARAARVTSSIAMRRDAAGGEWGQLSPQLEKCLKLNRDKRGKCITAAESWLSRYRAISVRIPGGAEVVETDCGERRRLFSEQTETFTAAEVPAAEALLVRLKAADAPAAGIAGPRGRNSVGMSFVRVAPGSFVMGSPSNESGRGSDETQHRVRLTRTYLMQTTEVTQGQWRAVMGSNPSLRSFKGTSLLGDDLPVQKVSWLDAVRFANALSKKEGLTPAYKISGERVEWDRSSSGYRLPTEAEWEYAARAGEHGLYAGTDDGSAACRYASVATQRLKDRFGWSHSTFQCEDGYFAAAPVGSFRPNAWGLYDMTGNVWEWCWDWDGKYGGDSTDPVGPQSGAYRIMRGGSWFDRPAYVRVANLSGKAPNGRSWKLGLRLLRTLH
ncbi:MAG: formylglycine-generating enzyme family protein [Myxococcota bacterium]|nr:formylglycine-generating enzyme family protein [Myxococcota bacterium]